MKKRKRATANSKGNSREERIERLARFRFQPGQSGNPSGRPKTKPFREALLRMLDMTFPRDKRTTYGEKILREIMEDAIDGSAGIRDSMRHLIAESLDGKTTTVAGDPSAPLSAEITVKGDDVIGKLLGGAVSGAAAGAPPQKA